MRPHHPPIAAAWPRPAPLRRPRAAPRPPSPTRSPAVRRPRHARRSPRSADGLRFRREPPTRPATSAPGRGRVAARALRRAAAHRPRRLARARTAATARASSRSLDYNRVDLLRLGLGCRDPAARARMDPRLGARLEYATGRERALYGVQLEQPLLPPRPARARRLDGAAHRPQRAAAGRRRREQPGAAVRPPGLPRLLRARGRRRLPVVARPRLLDRERARAQRHATARCALERGTRSLFHRDRAAARQPADRRGRGRTPCCCGSSAWRSAPRRTRAGLYHWIELERAGGGLGGDFDYTRALADVRSVVRLSPAATLALRAVGGTTLARRAAGAEASSRVGGVDGLRAHAFAQYRGDQLAAGQAEYTIGAVARAPARLRGRPARDRVRGRGPGLGRRRARAGTSAGSTSQVDGGFGLGHRRRTTCASTSPATCRTATRTSVVSVRLQRPF